MVVGALEVFPVIEDLFSCQRHGSKICLGARKLVKYQNIKKSIRINYKYMSRIWSFSLLVFFFIYLRVDEKGLPENYIIPSFCRKIKYSGQ